MESVHWQDAVAFFVGAGMVAVVFLLKVVPPEGVSLAAATWNFIAVGIAVLIVAGSALYAYRQWEEWVLLLLGLWMAMSPWALGYSEVAAYTTMALVSGLVLALLAGATVLWTGGSTAR